MKHSALPPLPGDSNPEHYMRFIETVCELEGSPRLKLKLIYSTLAHFFQQDQELAQTRGDHEK